jgi:hypothetical protein
VLAMAVLAAVPALEFLVWYRLLFHKLLKLCPCYLYIDYLQLQVQLRPKQQMLLLSNLTFSFQF